MPSNNTGRIVKDLADRFPGRVAHLFAPGTGSWRTPFLDYAVDNGAFGEKRHGREYDHPALLGVLAKCERLELEHGIRPLWLACPDVVFDRAGTLALWRGIAPWVRALYEYPLALVVQDGMMPEDVFVLAERPDLIFVGGSTTDRGRAGWKWDSLPMWTAFFPRVHVGRVNSPEKLDVCHKLGVESIDGTGWVMATRERPNQFNGLVSFLARTSPRA